jgi:hypothetical protein
MYFSTSWKNVTNPLIDGPLNFGLGLIGVLTLVIVFTKVRGAVGYLRRLKNSRRRRADLYARLKRRKSRLTARELQYITTAQFPTISFNRASQHIFHSWQGERIFETDLGRYDHAILLLASLVVILGLFFMFLLRRHDGPWLLLPPDSVLQPIFDWWFFVGLVASFGPGHYRAYRTAESVARNALRYQKSEEVLIDEDIWNLVKKFEAATGWRMVWSDNPDHLVGTDWSTRTVILNVGWVLLSDRSRDRRRAGYLTEVLRLIRHAAIRESLPKNSMRLLFNNGH